MYSLRDPFGSNEIFQDVTKSMKIYFDHCVVSEILIDLQRSPIS